jgi:hypothetical protein
MTEERIPDDVFVRLRKMFDGTTAGLALTPHAVAGALRSLGWPVSDALVLKVYEQLRVPAEEPQEVVEARAFLEDHGAYVQWQQDVAAGRTLGGFFEWRGQQS